MRRILAFLLLLLLVMPLSVFAEVSTFLGNEFDKWRTDMKNAGSGAGQGDMVATGGAELNLQVVAGSTLSLQHTLLNAYHLILAYGSGIEATAHLEIINTVLNAERAYKTQTQKINTGNISQDTVITDDNQFYMERKNHVDAFKGYGDFILQDEDYFKDYTKLKEHLQMMLSNEIPKLYLEVLRYASVKDQQGKSLFNDTAKMNNLATIQNALITIAAFNDKYSAAPYSLKQEDRLSEAADKWHAQRVLDEFTAEWKELAEKIDKVVQEDVRLANIEREGFDRIHKSIGYVNHFTEVMDASSIEDIGAPLKEWCERNNFPFSYDMVTGVDVWQPMAELESSSVAHTERLHGLEEGVLLRDEYLAMFAATSVYTPLHSRVGESDYMEALFHLLGAEASNQADRELVQERFATINQYKKPLFFLKDKNAIKEASGLGYTYMNMNGPVQRLLLGDIITNIEGGGTLIAVTIPGRMMSDGDSWSYYNNLLTTDNNRLSISYTTVEDAQTSNLSTYTRPVFELCSDQRSTPTPGQITSAMMYNIFQDEYLRSEWELRKGETLYLDAIGNIILSDGTLILPAAANPVYFAVPFTPKWANSNNLIDLLIGDEIWWYNPFTVAFWNTYPVIYGKTTSPSIQTKKDKKKWIACSDHLIDPENYAFIKLEQETSFANPIEMLKYFGTGGGDFWGSVSERINNYLEYYKYGLQPISDIKRNIKSRIFTSGLFYPYLSVPSGPNQFTTLPYVEVLEKEIGIGDDDSFTSKPRSNPFRLLPVDIGGIQVFPYNRQAGIVHDQYSSVDGNEDFRPAKLIAENMYRYITLQDVNDPSVPKGNGMLRESYMFGTVVCSVLDGMLTPVSYEKSKAVENLLLTNTTNIFEDVFLWVSRGIAGFGKHVVNFIGVASPDEASVLGPIYKFIHTYAWVVLFILLLILLLIFIRSRNLGKTLMTGMVLFLSIYGFLYLVPRFIPFVIGTPVSVLSEEIVGSAILVKGEQYDRVYSDDPKGQFSLGSIKLYDLTLEEAYQIRDQWGVTPAGFMTDRVSIDDTVGLYLVGTEVRLDLQTFWAQNCFTSVPFNYLGDDPDLDKRLADTYRTRSQPEYSNNHIKAYQIVADRHMDSPEMIDHYAPLLYLQDGFVITLNQFLRAYKIPRSVITYPDGHTKDTYLISSFTNSYPFLAVLPQVQNELNQSGNFEEARTLLEYFPNPGDILQLQELVETEYADLPADLVNTVWIRAMFKNGYFDPHVGRERRQDLANRVNQEAYDFLIRCTPEIGLVSDENMIRLTALYATFAFNAQISRFGDMVYPRYISFNELNVTDILTSSILKQSSRFMFYDVDLVSNVYIEKGFLGLLSVDFLIIIMCLIALINSAILPIAYIGSLLVLMLLALSGKNISGVLGFAAKMILILFGTNIISTAILMAYPALPYNLNIYLVLVFMGALLFFAFFAIKRVIKTTKWLPESKVGTVVGRVRQRAALMTQGLNLPQGSRTVVYSGSDYMGTDYSSYMPGMQDQESEESGIYEDKSGSRGRRHSDY